MQVKIKNAIFLHILVPQKNDTVDWDAFEKLLTEEKQNDYYLNDDKIYWGMFYAIPTFHNPTGVTMSPGNQNKNFF